MNLDKIIDIDGISTGKRLRLKRILEGLTQAELSRQLDIPQSTLSKYELDDREIREEHYRAIYTYITE